MNGNGARPDVWAADLEAPRARIAELERDLARLTETNAAHAEAHALMAARLERAQVDMLTVCERADQAEQQVAAVRDVLAQRARPTDRIGDLPAAILRALDQEPTR